MRRFGLKQAKFTDDRGAALGMVLIMIVFLSVLVVSVSFLTQSASKSVAINSAESAKRSELVNSAFSQALNYLAQPNGNGEYYGSEALPCGDITSKYDITISCTEAPRSGVNDALGSLALVGTDCNTTEKAGASLCSIGVHGGLDVECATDGCPETSASAANRLKITGGIVNSSGAYKNLSPYTLSLVTRVGQDEPQLVHPEIQYEPDGTIKPSGCPTYNFSDIKCDDPRYRPCPVVWVTDDGDSSIDGEYADECVTSTRLNPAPAVALPTTKVKNYLDFAYAKLANVGNSGPATTSQSGSVCTWRVPAGKTSATMTFTTRSGGSTSPLDDLLNQMKSSSSCRTIIFSPGVYYFNSTTPFIWQIQKFTNSNIRSIIGGTRLGSTTECDQTQAGVQFQFAGQTRISMLGGNMSLCGLTANNADKNEPVVATVPTTATNSWDGSDNSAFLTVDGLASTDPTLPGPTRWTAATIKTGAAGTTSILNIHGLMLAPAGSADINLNSTNVNETIVAIDGGAVLRAARIYEGGGSFTTIINSANPNVSGTDMPKTYNGDRVVQLKFWRGTNLSKANRTQDKIMGFIQVRIYDYFGLKPNSGYKILTWRAAW